MFKKIEAKTLGGQAALYIDERPVFSAKKIFDAKFFNSSSMAATVHLADDGVAVSFIASFNLRGRQFSRREIVLAPQPKFGTRAVLEVSPRTNMPFVHYIGQDGMIYIVTQDGRLGPFKEKEADWLLEAMRYKYWLRSNR